MNPSRPPLKGRRKRNGEIEKSPVRATYYNPGQRPGIKTNNLNYNQMNNYNIQEALEQLGLKEVNYGVCTGTEWKETPGDIKTSYSPADGKVIAGVLQGTKDDYNEVVSTAQEAFKKWRVIPAPKRGEIVRQIGLELRKYKEPLATIVSYEMGKIYQEGLVEVQ